MADDKFSGGNDTLIEWEAPVRKEHVRGKKWYICASLTAALLTIYSIYSKSWSFTAVLLLTMALYVYVHREKLPKKKIRIFSSGIEFDDKPHPISDFQGFWILEIDEAYSELHLEMTDPRKKSIVISLGQNDSENIRKVLGNLLNELENKHEKLFDKIIRICKL
ncbi:MAG: hypothetical protein UW70_C0031G0006 [Candidatus Peregrinibacteria bacterium GW2011_GWA2_44_7]|nr:MAG: hypothetical protein UW70_C0031G0006 [Candidatus Peregrinibacteria bacterium GW2011_GWA2_44_7]